MPNDDSSYKFLFSIPEMVRDLVLGFIPDPWLHSLNFTTLENGQLPPVLPIVMYNGSAKWTAATNVANLIPTVPGLVQQFKPSLNYLLIDENRYSEAELAPLQNLVAAVFRLEHPIDQNSIKQLLLSLSEWLVDRPDIRRMLAIWIRATLMEKPNYGILLNEVNDLDEVRVMLSDKLEEWAKEYIAEGRQEGRQEGEILALQKLLAKRFGAIPFDITAQIANASLDQIEHWFDKAIDADTLSDVFQ